MDFITDYESESSSSEGTEYADLDNLCKPANPNDPAGPPAWKNIQSPVEVIFKWP